jgi:hypothetical protein
MKNFLLPFVYGLCAVALVGGIVWLLLDFLGENFLLLVMLLIVVWGVGATIRDFIKDMKE